MPEWMSLIFLTSLAGAAIPLGAIFAKFERIPIPWLARDFHHFMIAFGGGALLSAVALVLVPESIHNLSVAQASLWLLAGACGFMALDMVLDTLNTPMSQLVAMLADFLPEALALGAAFAFHNESAFLLAIVIALQNFPEGFNAYHELVGNTILNRRRILIVFTLFALLGPVMGLIGYVYLAEYVQTVSAIMIFASGGILYLLFQDIAPASKIERDWVPALGGVVGFLLGMVGKMMVHS